MIGRLVLVFKSLDPLAIIILAPESSTLLTTSEIPWRFLPYFLNAPRLFFGTGNADSTGLYFKPSGMTLTQPSSTCSAVLHEDWVVKTMGVRTTRISER